MPDKQSRDKKRKKVKKKEGVYYRDGKQLGTSTPERTYYIVYRNTAGKKVEEKAGVTSKGMTATDAAVLRAARISGKDTSNREKRELDRAGNEAWNFDRLWAQWKAVNATKKGLYNDDNRYLTHLQGPFGKKEPKDVVPLDVNRLKAKLLKDPAGRPGRKFDPAAKRRSDYATKTKQALAEKAVAKAGEGKPYAIGTVVRILSLFRRIASFGVKQQICPGLSFTVEIPKGAKQRTENMTDEQMREYVKVCREWPDPQEGNFQLLQIYTGLRRGEVRKLRWDDINEQTGFVTLRDPKGGEDVIIPLSDEARKMLKDHPRCEEIPFVFFGEKGAQRGIHQIENSSREIRKAAGLPDDFRPNHGLRHTFASHLANSGEVDLYLLQRLLTHKDPKTTARYAHLRDEVLRNGANVMGRIVKEAGESA